MTDEIPAVRLTDSSLVLAVASRLSRPQPGSAGPGPAAGGGTTTGRAAELLRELSRPGSDRMREAGASGADAARDIAWPESWRYALYAVELCQRAAEMAARR